MSASPARKPGTPRRKAAPPLGRAPMLSAVTARGQTTVPSSLRAKYDLRGGTRLEWLDDGEMMLVIPVASDPIQQFRGKSKATLTLNLLRDRKVQRNRER